MQIPEKKDFYADKNRQDPEVEQAYLLTMLEQRLTDQGLSSKSGLPPVLLIKFYLFI